MAGEKGTTARFSPISPIKDFLKLFFIVCTFFDLTSYNAGLAAAGKNADRGARQKLGERPKVEALMVEP